MRRALALIGAIAVGCDASPPAMVILPPSKPAQPRVVDPSVALQPAHVVIQHILIAFKGTLSHPREVTRTKEEAEKLAKILFERAKKGENFSSLTLSFSDDTWDGIYPMYNLNAEPIGAEEFPRDGMVPSFGDVAFSLKVGEIGMAEFHPEKSKFGWHIIKRLR